MSRLKPLPAAAFAALALGVAATALSLRGEPGFGAVRLGAWTSFPRIGGADIDPYGRAVVALGGAMPLGEGEGLAFVADRDDDGRALDSRCDYLISGAALPARLWTLSAYDLEGRLRPNEADRHGLTSVGLLRRKGGDFAIAAARAARPGNWLPLGEKSRFLLVLRAYEAGASSLAGAFEGWNAPKIARGDCS
ncbi:DUF1214 domain-containing protein [uncultured Rhodoblastus sp.]|uniref:DUF1214 domain-containing protein n=1 Tax=uncultured Rhodoblastus sp. TaxID=543037 RepID=UPI0025E9E171|nr:DUF1214 domain-containing protein [uncultured Rhodoblastus sp.]